MTFLISKDTKLFYQTYGTTGNWVTLINGHTRSHSDFKSFARFLVKEGYRVLTFDNRGSGQTTYQPGFSFEDLVNDVKNLWSYLDIDSSLVLGISMGGMISQILAATLPNQVVGLALVSTTHESKWILNDAHKSWGSSLDEVFSKLSRYFSNRFVEKNRLLVDAMSKQIFRDIDKGNFSQGAGDQRHAMQGINLSTHCKNIICPTLILHGKEDQIIDYAAASELAKNIPYSHLEVIPNVGHLLLAEYAKPMYEIVSEFFKTTDRED